MFWNNSNFKQRNSFYGNNRQSDSHFWQNRFNGFGFRQPYGHTAPPPYGNTVQPYIPYGDHRHKDGQHNPHMPQQSPHMPQHNPHIPQQSPHMPQHNPHMPQHNPHMPQQSPHMPQHNPHMPQHNPHMPQMPLQRQTPGVPQISPPNVPASGQNENTARQHQRQSGLNAPLAGQMPSPNTAKPPVDMHKAQKSGTYMQLPAHMQAGDAVRQQPTEASIQPVNAGGEGENILNKLKNVGTFMGYPEYTLPDTEASPHIEQAEHNSIYALKDFCQGEKNGAQFYEYLAGVSKNEAGKNILNSISARAENRCGRLKTIYNSLANDEFLPESKQLNLNIDYYSGVKLAVKEESRSLKNIAEMAENTFDNDLKQKLNNVIIEKLCQINELNLLSEPF